MQSIIPYHKNNHHQIKSFFSWGISTLKNNNKKHECNKVHNNPRSAVERNKTCQQHHRCIGTLRLACKLYEFHPPIKHFNQRFPIFYLCHSLSFWRERNVAVIIMLPTLCAIASHQSRSNNPSSISIPFVCRRKRQSAFVLGKAICLALRSSYLERS